MIYIIIYPDISQLQIKKPIKAAFSRLNTAKLQNGEKMTIAADCFTPLSGLFWLFVALSLGVIVHSHAQTAFCVAIAWLNFAIVQIEN